MNAKIDELWLLTSGITDPISRGTAYLTMFTAWFVDKVKTNGDWDWKNAPAWAAADVGEAYGNWFFGVVGTYFYGETVSRVGAGLYQTFFQGGPQSTIGPPYWGDQKRDQEQISRGSSWLRNNCHE